ncbi:NADH-quinone oxidoreductase subunit K [Pseudenhygromyxa sp. WMMC2535]|uniref:NADH-quinone oxidoreductase subunit NuoK n=1 Tax=Pseudenhygromyxa sp. WMMC2535 TaxID=2712867 RepID=UPI001552A729|nr:NADH-quinone oxidoreductase subunit K [Pseudenhygromyxa sp. WMMC2535]NVB40794.1 NADH-quinone oxidoreductase subunit K [Pseudenhygromyxa sp. WMMC2535]
MDSSIASIYPLYLAASLFLVGLCGAVLRRSMLAVLLGVQLMFVGVALIFATYAQQHGEGAGIGVAALILMVGALEVALAAAVILRAYHAGGAQAAAELLADWSAGPERLRDEEPEPDPDPEPEPDSEQAREEPRR